MTSHKNIDSETLILNHAQVGHKLDRIAFEIYESHYQDKEIIIIGISVRGTFLAKQLKQRLNEISDLEISLAEISMDKSNPSDSVQLSNNVSIEEKPVILVDDVLNTGRTLIYATKKLLDYNVSRLTTVILVNRRHRLFPIRADIVGMTLATTLQEHIDVNIDSEEINVFLR
ncbi:MAG: phosphoribosyltransferase [Flavobacteriales bacterium]|nr:phosphoribosyltransferase [Flavobacteriales bacterium]